MRLKCVCKCGLEDWLSHWKHGIKRPHGIFGNYPKLRAVYLFLLTTVEIVK